MTRLDKYLRPYQRMSAWPWAAIGAVLVIVLATLHEMDSMLTETSELQVLAERMRVAPSPKPRIGRAEEERHAEWSKLAEERKFNWYPVFVTLEKASSEDIELLEFRPDKANGLIILRGEARNMVGLIDYLERLSQQPLIKRVYLSHQKAGSRDAMQVVTFEIQAMMRDVR